VTRVAPALVSRLTAELAGWLEGPPEDRAAVLATWRPDDWSAFRRVVTVQGLAPHLARILPTSPVAAAVQPATLDWLAGQADQNARRIGRMHQELAAILAAAATAGIEVMPLKGAILTTLPGTDPARRPMADLDLLVHPGDREPLAAVLTGLGYAREPDDAPHPTHDVFLDPSRARVPGHDGEHPDNPRRVEVHVEVKRHLWGWATDDDLTDTLWRNSVRDVILGQPASVPERRALLAHLAIHATCDLLVGRGRLVQWLDLGSVAPVVTGFDTLPHPRVAYPSLRLAARALPGAMAGAGSELAALERNVPPRLARWASAVTLDAQCGLTKGRPPDAPARFGARWERWRPERWRLDVAYGDVGLPTAMTRYGRMVIARTLGRYRA
jgi:Uncharacterised nucleotidyltransferase